ncbi:MAG: TSUP family transporter [Clostridia bacterium]
MKKRITFIVFLCAIVAASLFFYGWRSHLDYMLALKVSVGGVIGGLIGAKLLKKLSGNVIRKIFGAFMILAALRMVVG